MTRVGGHPDLRAFGEQWGPCRGEGEEGALQGSGSCGGGGDHTRGEKPGTWPARLCGAAATQPRPHSQRSRHETFYCSRFYFKIKLRSAFAYLSTFYRLGLWNLRGCKVGRSGGLSAGPSLGRQPQGLPVRCGEGGNGPRMGCGVQLCSEAFGGGLRGVRGGCGLPPWEPGGVWGQWPLPQVSPWAGDAAPGPLVPGMAGILRDCRGLRNPGRRKTAPLVLAQRGPCAVSPARAVSPSRFPLLLERRGC